MLSSDEEVLANIDATLDQLIDHAEILHHHEGLLEYEVDALQKTQESLLAHLLYLEKKLNGETKKAAPRKNTAVIRRKLSRYSSLNARLLRRVTSRFCAARRKSA